MVSVTRGSATIERETLGSESFWQQAPWRFADRRREAREEETRGSTYRQIARVADRPPRARTHLLLHFSRRAIRAGETIISLTIPRTISSGTGCIVYPWLGWIVVRRPAPPSFGPSYGGYYAKRRTRESTDEFAAAAGEGRGDSRI